jgi:hypothetical protein
LNAAPLESRGWNAGIGWWMNWAILAISGSSLAYPSSSLKGAELAPSAGPWLRKTIRNLFP